MDIHPAFEEVAHRLQRGGPSSMALHPAQADAIAWLWNGWDCLIPTNLTRQGVWILTNAERSHCVAFDTTDAARQWPALNNEERYWACFMPLIDPATSTYSAYVAIGDTLVDLIANMSTRRYPDRLAWVAAAQHALTGPSEEAQTAALLVGLGGGGDMGALALRHHPLTGASPSR
jgi:hypothetical protein